MGPTLLVLLLCKSKDIEINLNSDENVKCEISFSIDEDDLATFSIRTPSHYEVISKE